MCRFATAVPLSTISCCVVSDLITAMLFVHHYNYFALVYSKTKEDFEYSCRWHACGGVDR